MYPSKQKNSFLEVFYKKVVLKNFAKNHKKIHLPEFLFDKVEVGMLKLY